MRVLPTGRIERGARVAGGGPEEDPRRHLPGRRAARATPGKEKNGRLRHDRTKGVRMILTRYSLRRASVAAGRFPGAGGLLRERAGGAELVQGGAADPPGEVHPRREAEPGIEPVDGADQCDVAGALQLLDGDAPRDPELPGEGAYHLADEGHVAPAELPAGLEVEVLPGPELLLGKVLESDEGEGAGGCGDGHGTRSAPGVELDLSLLREEQRGKSRGGKAREILGAVCQPVRDGAYMSRSLCGSADGGFDPDAQILPQLCRRLPNDVVLMLRVEVQLLLVEARL